MNRYRCGVPQAFRVLMAIILLLSGCAPSISSTKPAAAGTKPASGDPYKIGAINSISGYMAAFGRPYRETYVLLEEKLNAEGGINGRPVKLIYYDDESNESKGLLLMKKVIEQDQVIGILATNATGVAMAQAPVVEEAQVPWITNQAGHAVLEPPKKWIFKAPTSEVFWADTALALMKEQKLSRLAILTQGAGMGKEAKKAIERRAPNWGVIIVGNEAYNPAGNDFTPELIKIKASNPEVVYVVGVEPAGAMAIGQAKRLGLNVWAMEGFTATDIIGAKEIIEGFEGVTFVTHKADIWEQLSDSDPQKRLLRDLDRLVKEKYQRNLSLSDANAHDAFSVMMNAILNANPDTSNVVKARSQIRDALEKTKDFMGANFYHTYSPDDHEGPADLQVKVGVIMRFENGKFKLVKMAEELLLK